MRLSSVFALAVILLACTHVAHADLRSVPFVTGLSSPVAIVQDPSDRHVQMVVQQGGRIRVVVDGVLQPVDFLNLTGSLAVSSERGLLGMAFAPDYGESGRFFVNFTNPSGHTVVARYTRSAASPRVADPASRFDLRWNGATGPAFIEQPYSNHNGGQLAFGSDGYLYVGLGDGGSGDDPEHRAQNPATLLGKMLRIDVAVPASHPIGYLVPADNPFVGAAGTRPEIWSFGLRNPWRYSFDDWTRGGTGALIMGDVGQGRFEEIDYEPALAGGRNYGWRNREGAHAHIATPPPAFQPLTDPVFEYGRTVGQSVIGGYVYRGQRLGSRYHGRYFFADFVTARVWSLSLTVNPSTSDATASDLVDHTPQLGALGNITSFGTDADGELYVVSQLGGGTIFRLLGSNPLRDFDGDARSEISVYRPGTGQWFTLRSQLAYDRTQYVEHAWGYLEDQPLRADFDGDGRDELAVFRPATGQWFLRYSTLGYDAGSYGLFQWGHRGDQPLAADFDGDGRADLAVYRPATGGWYVRYSSDGFDPAGADTFQWGYLGDLPVAADFDGDGRTELAVFRPATGHWFIRFSRSNFDESAATIIQWGHQGDVPLIADLDADGRAELTVYRPATGQWFVRYSSQSYAPGGASVINWGAGGETPLTLDVDRDGLSDLAMYQPATGVWRILRSATGYQTSSALTIQWGYPGDQPLR